MIPKEFFVTGGEAISPISQLNAFDRALKNARIEQCNLVPVSSILPPTCKEREWKKIPAGSITYTVIARMDGKGETTIAAGIAWAWGKNMIHGLIAEANGHMDKKTLEKTLKWRIKEMAKTRGIEIEKIGYRAEVLRVPIENYGCVIAALVFIP